MTVSVCMATYNGQNYILQQLVSILNQLGPSDELIISDDGSTDETLSIVESLDDKRIKIYHNQSNHGVVGNFNNALVHASGDIIFLADQDDIWADNKVEIMMDKLKDYDAVVHNFLFMNGEGVVSDNDFFSIHPSRSGFWNNLYRNGFMGSCMAFRKKVLDDALPLPKHILWHDMWIGLMAEKKGRTCFIPDTLLYYRRHGDNVSATGEKSTFSRWFQLKYRLQMLWYFLFR